MFYDFWRCKFLIDLTTERYERPSLSGEETLDQASHKDSPYQTLPEFVETFNILRTAIERRLKNRYKN